jgi:quercetin dioxygenase-like cupin family protein
MTETTSQVQKVVELIGIRTARWSAVRLSAIDGSVTLFAFDAEQGLSEHTAPFDALVLILDGEAESRSPGRLIT